MSLAKTYNPATVEDKWYSHWMERNYFHSEPDEREAFSITIPPPNVTGVLHMGHILNNTIQDILIRRARMLGKNACWVPGTDHASIATEAKVVRRLREQGIKKSDLTRDEFMKHAWAWKEEFGGIILEQLKKLGCSCDWERTRFTMEPEMSDAVLEVFVDLHKKGHIFRGLRMINWDPQAQTALSNEEVIHRDVNASLYFVRYQIEGTDGTSDSDWITIATTRPETILGDTAVCFHPEDERYSHMKGKSVLVPLLKRSIPTIFDDYIDMEFGTGALKVTPAHDPNDYDLGKKHELEVIDVLNANGTMSEAAEMYIGEDRMAVRKQIVKDLEAAGHLVKIEDLNHSVGFSERTDAVVEPRLSLQWFLDMKELSKPALKAVMEGEINLVPDKFVNTYRHWMENIHEWCISRQLWWGQRIPAWYYGEGDEDYVVAIAQDDALALAREKSGNADLAAADLKQDEDVLDTWASSWLWPISVFDGFKDPKGSDISYYYPTDVLVTAPEILFFWVARMIIAGYEYRGEKPFSDVYLTGIVRDKQRRKMSKSLGNSPDPLDMIAEYGADGIRLGMLMASSAGNDILFDEKLCETGKKFCNKIWNAFKLVKGWEINEGSSDENAAAVQWFEHKLSATITDLDEMMAEFRISEGLKMLYSFIWNDLFNSYLEYIKPAFGEPIDRATYDKTIDFFGQILQLLHPFMPFITEEIWHLLADRAAGEDIIVSSWPKAAAVDQQILAEGKTAQDIISSVRDLRSKNGLSPKEALPLRAKIDDFSALKTFAPIVQKAAHLSAFEATSEDVEGAASFISGTTKFFLEIGDLIDSDQEKERLQKELEYQTGFMKTVEKKLGNERFVSNAPEQVVANERKKLADAQARIQSLEESLARLN